MRFPALGIVAGGGELPRAIATSAREQGRAVFVLALRDLTGKWVADFPHSWLSMGQIGRTLSLLRSNACNEVVFAGYVSRPKLLKLRYDQKGLSWLIPVLWAMRGGDNTLLEAMVGLFEREGLRVKSVAEVAPQLQIPAGPLGQVKPNAEAQADIALALSIARQQGMRDRGQAVVASEGRILGIEGTDGTDAMLIKLRDSKNRGVSGRGVLVKALKPIQDRKTDLPTIGLATVENVAAAGLAGIAVEAHTALVLDRLEVARAADALGIFVLGIETAS